MKIILNLCFFFILLLKIKTEEEKKNLFPPSDNIIELDQDDYDGYVKENRYIILIFYTQWCEQCMKAMSILEEIAKYCKENNDFIILRVDTDKNQYLAENLLLSKLPSIYYIIDSSPKKYSGIVSYDEIKEFIELKLKGPIIRFKTLNEIDNFVNKKKITLLSTQPNEIFKSLSKKFEDIIYFSQCVTNECKEKYNSDIVLLKNYDEKIIKFNNETISKESITDFLRKYSIEKGGIINQLGMQFLFQFKKTTLIYFRNQNNSDFTKYDKIIKEVANKYNEKMYFFISDIEGDDFSIKIGNFFNIQEDDIPSIQIFDLTKIYGKVNSYEFNLKDNKINKENLEKFIDDFYKGKLEKKLESEPIPQDAFSYMTVVGKNFNEVVFLSNKNVIVLFINDNCKKCDDASMKFVELATKYNKDLKSDKIEFRIINLSHNSIKYFTINKFPSVYLFKVKQKDKPIEYEFNNNIISKDLEEWAFKLCELGEIPNWEKNITELMKKEEEKAKKIQNEKEKEYANKEDL